MNGRITEIERFALNDGPGIRTTVFLKGCNMRCAWCHNPETIGRGRELLYHANKCIGCYKCVYACPSKAQKRIDGVHRYFPNLCVRCGRCAEICYAGAMEVSGKELTVGEVMAEIVQDKPYYQSSGGGVTLSGGEVLCQPEFAGALADACRAEGIPVAIESNLNAEWTVIAPLLEKLDLVMCDLKLADGEAHKRWTGVDNALIRENLGRLAENGKPFWVRTPLIPGATDSDENIRAIAAFLAGINTKGSLVWYELLNFNPLGSSKYESLRRQNPFADAKPLSSARVAELKAVAAQAGIPVRTEQG